MDVASAKQLAEQLKSHFSISETAAKRVLTTTRKTAFEKTMKGLLAELITLSAVTADETKKQMKACFAKLQMTQGKAYKLFANPHSTNGDLQIHALELADFILDTLYVCTGDDFILEPWVKDASLQAFPRHLYPSIAQHFHSSRSVCVFQSHIGEGGDLLAFKRHLRTEHEVTLYGTDSEPVYCDLALSNGVDYVAKKGIRYMSPGCFDLTLIRLDSFYFQKDAWYDNRISSHFQEGIPADNGYVLFNLPSFLLPHYQKTINYRMLIDDVYRLDDPMKSVLIVARKKRDKGENEPKIRQALLRYSSLPSIEQMKEYYINQGNYTPPAVFKPVFIEEKDVMREFVGMNSPVSLLEDFYKPVERIVQYSRPLQEIKEGHYPAIATSEITNGINDTNYLKHLTGEDLDFVHLFCTKIVQQDVQEVKRVMHNGEEVDEISDKKMNFIVSNVWTQDGELIELLDTQNDSKRSG